MTYRQELQERLDALREQMAQAAARSGRPAGAIRLIAITKTHPVETLQALIDCGVGELGENRVQEIAAKAPLLRGSFTLHMVGHLQRNKAGKALAYVQWVQSIDRAPLLDAIERRLRETGGRIRGLVEVNTSGEQSKSGCAPDEAADLCARVAASGCVEFRGVMTIGPLDGGERATRAAFARLRGIGEQCRALVPEPELSMGMSDDFIWAIEEGATMVRIGSRLLGPRQGQP